MNDGGEPLDELAEAVLEGRTVDWAAVESAEGAAHRKAVHQLRVLAGINQLHRSLNADGSGVPGQSASDEALGSWGRLRLLERIGGGSFGDVYRSWDTKLDREVAVKLLHDGGGQPKAASVLGEARLLARIRHSNVVTVYDADEIDGRVGLWMEFIRGRNLEQVLKERQRFDHHEVTRIGIELCKALSAVHEAGLVHRDIKAQNLMQTDDGRLVLMDFGTGRDLARKSSSEVDAAGTPLYLAPEVFGGEEATARSDIYSTGVLLFHLLTGTYPVRGGTVQEIDEAHARGERVDLTAGAPRATRSLIAVIDRAIRPDPAERFDSAQEMLAALERIAREVEARRRKSYAFAAAVVAAIAIAAVAGLIRSDQGRGGRARPGAAAYAGSSAEKRAVQFPKERMVGTPSPDGRYLPYSELATGNLALYEFATGTSRVLTRDADDDHSAAESVVSPDGSQVAYFWDDGTRDGNELRVIDTHGGASKILNIAATNTTSIHPQEWSPDSLKILGTRQRPGGETEVILVSAQDGSIEELRTFEHAPLRVTLSPDNRYLAYDRAEDSSDTDRGIFLSALAGGEEMPIVTGPSYDSHPMWTPDGSGLVFASLRTGTPSLWRQRVRDGRADGNPELLDKNMGAFRPITLTHRGSLFYTSRTKSFDVYTVPIDSVTGDIRGEPKIAASRVQGSNLAADWSPDGSTLVFASWRTLFGPGRNILVFHPFNGGPERELALDVDVVNSPRWSPDGRLIAVGGADRQGVRALRLIDAESGRIVSTHFPLPGDVQPVGSPVWAPDGRHMYLKRQGKVWRFDPQSGEMVALYSQPPVSFLGPPAISPDGRSFAFNLNMFQEKASRLVVIPATGGAPRELVRAADPVRLNLGGWTRDGKQLLFVRITETEGRHYGEIWAVPSEGGAPRSLGLTMPSLRDLRVSPDGSRVSFTSGYPDQEMWVFENSLSLQEHANP